MEVAREQKSKISEQSSSTEIANRKTTKEQLEKALRFVLIALAKSKLKELKKEEGKEE